MPGVAKILITGAAGAVGTAAVPRLRARGHRLRLLDLEPPSAATDTDEVLLASATDETAMTYAAQGMDLLLHLASFASERSWREIIDVNVESARVALDAAHEAHVPVTVLASSVHATGFTPSDRADARVVRTRPDTYYGFSKVAAEALGDLHADRFGMRVVSARIMTFADQPPTARARSTWLSPDDFVRLVEASLSAPGGHSVVWGVSANTRRTVSLEAGRAMGYEPRDDAEDHVAALAARLGLASADELPPVGSDPLGGEFADPSTPLGRAW